MKSLQANRSMASIIRQLVLACIQLLVVCDMCNATEKPVDINILHAMQNYLSAQVKFKKNNLAAINGNPPKSYASSIKHLGGKNAYKDKDGKPINYIDPAIAEATKENGFNGYYFVDVALSRGKPINHLYEFALCAIPCEYEKTGTMTYYVDACGAIMQCDTKGKAVGDTAEINDNWMRAQNSQKISKKGATSKDGSTNPSTYDLAYPSPEEVVDEFVKAYNASDIYRLSGLFKRDINPSEWIDELSKAKKRKKNTVISVKIKSKRENDKMLVVEALVSAKEGNRFQIKNHTWLFGMEKTNAGYKLVKIRSKTAEKMNSQFTKARELSNRLSSADENKDWKVITDLFKFSSLDEHKICKGDEETFKKNRLGWLYQVFADPAIKIKFQGASRADKDLKITLNILGGNDKKSKCLYLTEKSDSKDAAEYIFRMPTEQEERLTLTKNIHDFWSAAEIADSICTINVTFEAEKRQLPANALGFRKKMRASIDSLLAKSPSISKREIRLPREIACRIHKEGKYVLPLFFIEKSPQIITGFYTIPLLGNDNQDDIISHISSWRGLGRDEKQIFLKDLLKEPACVDLHTDAIHYLDKLGYFEAKFMSVGEESFWASFIANESISTSAKKKALDSLSKNNFDTCKSSFLAALNNKELSFVSAQHYAKKDPVLLKSMMLEWLNDSEKLELALRNGHFLKTDSEFSQKAAQLYKDGEWKSLRLVLPYLLKSSIGEQKINHILLSSEIIPELGQIMNLLLKTRDRRFSEGVRGLYKRLRKVKLKKQDVIIASSLAYLCVIKDIEGIVWLEQYFDEIKDDEVKKRQMLITMCMATRQRFKTFEECVKWLQE